MSRRAERGQSTVELALVTPFLIILLLIAADGARVFSAYILNLGASSNNAFLDGAVYMPSNEFILSGNTGGTWARGQLIVGSFSVTGSSDGYIEHEPLVELGRPGVWLIR